MTKLERLARSEGLPVEEMLTQAFFDGKCPAICMNEGCNYTTNMEPDQSRGFCEVCGTNTVKSCLVLAKIE